jgi:nuclear mRNA export protein SAC3
MEQLRKVLQSLMEFYKDTRMSSSPLPLPNETEFRSYYALVFLRDNDVSRQLQTLSEDIFFSDAMLRSLRLRSLAQRSNDRFVQNNAEAAQNSFVRFFKEVQRSTTFLEACILETWFGSVRTGALKALRQALGVKAVQISQVSVSMLVKMLGFDDTEQLVAFCNYVGLELVNDERGDPKAVWFKRNIPWEGHSNHIISIKPLT